MTSKHAFVLSTRGRPHNTKREREREREILRRNKRVPFESEEEKFNKVQFFCATILYVLLCVSLKLSCFDESYPFFV